MTKTEFLQTMIPAEVKSEPELTPAEKAIAEIGIPPDAPYYAGALHNVRQVLSSQKTTSLQFWKSYHVSLCAHLAQLEGTAKQAEKNMVRVSIQTVRAILYALEVQS